MLDKGRSKPSTDRPDPIPLILEQLANGNDVIRTGAVRAAAAIGLQDKRVHEALIASLLDEDPDVRTDAMDALALCAHPEDAKTIRRSLLGDPVREVKHAAIGALTMIQDIDSVPIFRKLAISRAEDDVAWEDDTDAWDDWLDVQIAVIEALGKMKAQNSIQDILAARDDEEGQVLDGPVFTALAAMGSEGSEGSVWLLSVAQTETGLGRKRALEALSSTRSELLADCIDLIVSDEAADIRHLALPVLEANDPRVEDLVLRDPDANLRHEALNYFASERPEFSVKALSDSSEKVQAAALEHLVFPLDANLAGSLATNAIAWMRHGGEKLATASARILPQLAPQQASEVLLELINDNSRPLEARLVAVTSLSELTDTVSTEQLVTLMGNETQQVRAVAANRLALKSEKGDEAATHALAMAIDGTLLTPDRAVVTHPKENGPDLAMSKTDETNRNLVRISREGDIIEIESLEDLQTSQSTLGALQLANAPAPQEELAEDTPEESSSKRRHRRAVEGPDAIGEDLRVIALGIAGQLPDDAIETSVLKAASSENTALRLAAWRALLKRAELELIKPENSLGLKVGLSDENPAVRSTAAEILSKDPETARALADCLNDVDPLVRAIAIRHCADLEQSLDALNDATSVVRDAALEKVLSTEASHISETVFEVLAKAERIDTLAQACRQSDQVLTHCVQALAENDVTPKRIHVLLETIAATKRSSA